MLMKDLLKKTPEELRELLQEKRASLAKLRFEHKTAKIADPSLFSKTKRDIARITHLLASSK